MASSVPFMYLHKRSKFMSLVSLSVVVLGAERSFLIRDYIERASLISGSTTTTTTTHTLS